MQTARLPDYPWELIHDGTGFLLHNQVGFSRYIAFASVPPSLPAVEKVHVLLISSSASDKELDLKPLPKKERAAISEALKVAIENQRIQLTELPEPTLDELAAYLTQHTGNESPHLLHFDGHGLFGKRCTNPACRTMHQGIKAKECKKCSAPLPEAQGYLLFEDEYGDPDYVSASKLGTVLQQTQQNDGTCQTSGVAALVLSACQSGMAIVGESVFQGTAQNLIYHGVPAVVAMQYSVAVESAIAFSKQFYRSIGEKNSLAIAVSQGRAMMQDNQWYRPVFYLRWQDNLGGQLFATTTQEKPELKLGAPFQAPAQPETFVERPEITKELKARLFSQNSTLVISAIHGLGAVGKTTIATALAHDPEVQKHFPDGILWTTLGQEPESKILQELGKWIKALGDHNFQAQSEQEASDHLKRLLQERQVLLIVDDVWNFEYAEFFKVGSSGCQMLVTTRDSGVAQGLKASVYPLDVMKQKEALELLTKISKRTFVGEEAEQATKLAKEVGYLPLALELAAAQVAEGETSWSRLLQDLQQEIALLEGFDLPSARDYQKDDVKKLFSLTASLNLSVKCLNDSDRRDFIWLGITPEDTLLNPKMAKVLWSMEAVRNAQKSLIYLQNKALLLRGVPLSDGTPTYRMHDLVHDLARNLLTAPQKARRSGELEGLGVTLPEAHGELLERYRSEQKTSGLWHTLPDDGYIHQHLVRHLKKAGQIDEIHNLLAETSTTGANGWFEVQEQAGNTVDFINEIMLAWQSIEHRIDATAIGLQFRYALIRATVLNTFLNIPSDLFIELINADIWSIDDVLLLINTSTDVYERPQKLLDLIQALPRYQSEILSCLFTVLRQLENTYVGEIPAIVLSVYGSSYKGHRPKDDIGSILRKITFVITQDTNSEIKNELSRLLKKYRIENYKINDDSESEVSHLDFSLFASNREEVLKKLDHFRKINDQNRQKQTLEALEQTRSNPKQLKSLSEPEKLAINTQKNETLVLDEKAAREKIHEIIMSVPIVQWDPFDDDPLTEEGLTASRLVSLIPIMPESVMDELIQEIRINFHKGVPRYSCDLDILDKLAKYVHFLPKKHIMTLLSTINQYSRGSALKLLMSRIPDELIPELLRYSTMCFIGREPDEMFFLAINEVVKRLISMPIHELEKIWKDLVYGFSFLTRPEMLSLIEGLGPVFYRLGQDDVLEEVIQSIQCVGKW